MANELQENRINNSGKGLQTEVPYELQPEGTQRHVLNGVNESDSGDFMSLSNELGNIEVSKISDGYTIISKLYLEKQQVLLFCTNGVDSEIGVFDGGDNTYTIVLNDTLSESKLNLSVDFPIDSTYRLRRGCERTIYFTDYNSPPRVLNLDGIEDYNVDNLFSADKTNLFRITNSIPSFEALEMLDSGGQLLPGSYNIAVQYLDDSFNPTEWLNTTDTILVYNDSLLKDYKEIQGSINSTEEGLNFGYSNKSIKVKLSNLDTDFMYYRLALISSTSGNGQISSIDLTDVIPTQKDTFIFTGLNTVSKTTEAEIISEKLVISKARHILQVDNTLILGDTVGSEIPFCSLQQYASTINSDLILSKVTLDNIRSQNASKNPFVHIEGQGYTPGEIYSFGIQYIFENGEISPVYHIPGKPDTDTTVTYSSGDNVYPMSIDNKSLNTKYIENDSCEDLDYWGKDSKGNVLNNTFVRHHRFPLRSEVGVSLVDLEDSIVTSEKYQILSLSFEGQLKVHTSCDDASPIDCIPDYTRNTVITVRYTVDGVEKVETLDISHPTYYDGYDDYANIESGLDFITGKTSGEITNVSFVEYSYINGPEQVFEFSTNAKSPNTSLNYTFSVTEKVTQKIVKEYSTNIFGIRFSNIVIPPESLIGRKILGYQIVRNERTDAEKTILDSAVLTPCLQNDKYISHGLLFPEVNTNTPGSGIYNQVVFSLIHPEHKFFQKSIQGYDTVIQEGVFDVVNRKKSIIRYEDVADGTSYDAEVNNKNEKDEDGFDIKVPIRDNELEFKPLKAFTFTNNDVEDIFYLDALDSRDINKSANTVYNIAGDNKVGFIHLKNPITGLEAKNDRSYYVIFKRANLDSYSNFRNLEYYKEHDNYVSDESIDLFHGDSYISPMRYANTIFWDIQISKRAGKKSFWKWLAGAITIVGGVLLSVFSGGLSLGLVGLGAGLLVAGTGAMMLASGIKRDKWNKAYAEEYDKGLRETALDSWVYTMFRKRDNVELIPGDDEIQWIGEVATNFWFESKVNVAMRNGFVGDLPAFLESPGIIEDGNIQPETFYTLNGNKKIVSIQRTPVSDVEFFFASKLLYFDPDRSNARAYLGHPLGEYYNLNLDYMRRNKQKIYYHLPLEYDCCSECNEEFPHRWHWSQQSFQEELTDSYKSFLPNNYKDLNGETGRITNMFRINNDMFIHTEGALYMTPRNYQERVTDQIVSFIGTGELFSIPPQKISDGLISTGGTNLKWSNVKTIYGYFFVSDTDNAVYLFNGQNIKNISDTSIRKDLQDKLPLKGNKDFYEKNGFNSFYLDKVSGENGLGYSLVYDPKLRRVIITKIDRVNEYDTSLTISYDLKTENWVSYHSYTPRVYLQTPTEIYSVKDTAIYKHNIKGLHNNFYGVQYPFIIEYVSHDNPLLNSTTESISLHSNSYVYDSSLKEYYEVNDRFFNKMIAYNSRQCTGELELKMDTSSNDFFSSSITDNSFTSISVSCKENVYRVNELRDIRVNYNRPIFKKDLESLKGLEYMDKVLDTSTIDYDKDWSEKQMMRDKYLVVRFIFDNFADTKIVTNLSVKTETLSVR